MIVDEAAKSTEPETWNVLGNYRPRVFLLVGDHQQLKPTVVSSLTENNFAPQLSISLFARLRLAGIPTTMFDEQHRMQPDISRIVSEVSYGGALRDAASVKQEHPITAAICRANESLYNITKAVAFIDLVNGATTKSYMQSKEYVMNIAFVMSLVETLILRKYLKPEHILILVPYRAQYLR